MILNLVITGVGGQGNVLASQILGRAGVKKGLSVTIGETFGLSQRGGPVMSHVRFHDGRVVGPIIPPNMADIIMGLEPLETLRVLPELGRPDTLYLVNKRPIYPLNVIAGDVAYPPLEGIKEILQENSRKLLWVDGTTKSMELGGAIFLNTIMLGALVSLDNFPLTIEDIEEIFRVTFKGERLSQNLSALQIGRELVLEYDQES